MCQQQFSCLRGPTIVLVYKMGSVEDVRVGDVMVRLGERKHKRKEVNIGKEGNGTIVGGQLSVGGQPSIEKLVWMDRSRETKAFVIGFYDKW